MVMIMKKFFKILYALRYYLLSIFILMTIVALLDIFIFLKGFYPWYYVILFVTVSVIVVIFIDGLTAAFIHKLPKRLFNPERFKERKGEKKFFEIIKIKKWKDKIPEIGELTCDFSKGEIKDPNDPEYILMFLQEMGYAEVIHFLSCILGFLIVFVLPLDLRVMLSVGLPIAIINVFYNLLSALIQRYNRPKLYRVYIRKKQVLERLNRKDEI